MAATFSAEQLQSDCTVAETVCDDGDDIVRRPSVTHPLDSQRSDASQPDGVDHGQRLHVRGHTCAISRAMIADDTLVDDEVIRFLR